MKNVGVVIVNDILREENLVIIQFEGNEYIKRYKKKITSMVLGSHLEYIGVDIEDCEITVVSEGWNGLPKAERFYSKDGKITKQTQGMM